MLTDILKEQMRSLPGDQFTQVWKCIEEIDAALVKAGATALLALTFIHARNEERVLNALRMQESLLKTLREDVQANTVNVDEFNRLKAAYEATYRKLDKLKKKSRK